MEETPLPPFPYPFGDDLRDPETGAVLDPELVCGALNWRGEYVTDPITWRVMVAYWKSRRRDASRQTEPSYLGDAPCERLEGPQAGGGARGLSPAPVPRCSANPG
jgi:hypothetical protein